MLKRILSYNFILLGIVFLAAILRFFQLGINPPSLTWDEVAWGYNAYSLGIDGKDEFGRFLPYDYLESFGDFKPPMYAYLDILPVKLFGLNEFAVRFPSALLGVLTVLVTYFLTKRIFPKAQKFSVLGFQFSVAEVAALLLAISPWHINLSRAAFEANVSTFFLVSGVWLWLQAMSGKKWYLLLSIISFIVSTYTFNTARIVAPILVFFLAIGFNKQLLERKKHVFVVVVIGIMLLIPLASFVFTPQARLRFQEVNIFSDIGIINKSNQEVVNDNNVWWSKIIHNRRVGYGIEYMYHYFDNLNPAFLFIKGDGNPKFSTQDVGQMYLWELPFFIAGVFFLFRKREGIWWFIPLWIIIGIAPAAVARETPHALRIETILPTFQILTAYGVVLFYSWLKKARMANALKLLVLVFHFSFSCFYFLYYYHGYYAHYPREYSGEWQYGYKEAITYVKKVEGGYDKVYITENLGRPYIYTLFYTGYGPEQFRKEAVIEREVLGFVHVKQFSKYFFSKDINSLSSNTKKILYVGVPNAVPGSAKILKRFYLLNGNESLVAYTL